MTAVEASSFPSLKGRVESEAGNSPPDTGGVDATSRRSREASFNGADGVVENGTTSSKEGIPKHFGTPNHPVCAAAVASHLFLDGAATPPMSGGELPASHSFIASMTAPTSDLEVFATALIQEGSLLTRFEFFRSLLVTTLRKPSSCRVS